MTSNSTMSTMVQLAVARLEALAKLRRGYQQETRKVKYQLAFALFAFCVFSDWVLAYTVFYYQARQTAPRICAVLKDTSVALTPKTYFVPYFDRPGPELTNLMRRWREMPFQRCEFSLKFGDYFAGDNEFAIALFPLGFWAAPNNADYMLSIDLIEQTPSGDRKIAHATFRLEHHFVWNLYIVLRDILFIRPMEFLNLSPYFSRQFDNHWQHLWMMSYRGLFYAYERHADGSFHLSNINTDLAAGED